MAMVFVMWRVPKVGGGGALEAALPHAPASCLQLLRDLLAWNPLRRPSAKRALQYPFFLEVAAPAPPKVSILTLHPHTLGPASATSPLGVWVRDSRVSQPPAHDGPRTTPASGGDSAQAVSRHQSMKSVGSVSVFTTDDEDDGGDDGEFQGVCVCVCAACVRMSAA